MDDDNYPDLSLEATNPLNGNFWIVNYRGNSADGYWPTDTTSDWATVSLTLYDDYPGYPQERDMPVHPNSVNILFTETFQSFDHPDWDENPGC